MVNTQKVKQILMKRRDEMDLEEFEKHVRNTNHMFGTHFKADDFIPPMQDIFGEMI